MITFASLVVRETKAAILGVFRTVAQSVGLPVTSWQVGDPTDTQFQSYATVLDALEGVVAAWIKATFLDTAAADASLYGWLVWIAYQGFGYTARTASYASTTVELTNALGAVYDFDPGDVTFKCRVSGKTYRNTSGGHLASGPGATLTLDVVADEPGSASSAGIGDIDTMVTTYLGVTCTNAVAAVGLDAEPATSIVAGCRAKLAMMSPNGAREAYAYVATQPDLSGTTAITTARVSDDSTTGDVSVLVAGPNMPIAAPDIALAQAAIEQTCQPLCITATVASATAKTINVAYSIVAYSSWGVTSAEAADLIETALRLWFAERPIAGDVIPPATYGVIPVNMIEAVIKGVRPDKITMVGVTTPATATVIAATEKPVCGTVTATAPVVFIPDP